MFDFLDSDGFIIGLEIVFLTFIAYDAYKYFKTRRREYLLNIVLAIGFAIWVLYPFYTKYYKWEDKDRQSLIQNCLGEHNASYCNCVDDLIFKTYDLESFSRLDQQSEAFVEFIKDSEKECFEGSWF
jgi:hypothetical protein